MASRVWVLGRWARNFPKLWQFSKPNQQYFNLRRTLFTSSNLLGDPIQINMPALSPTMTEGTIIEWKKKEGDPIVPGDVLCEIRTDKATISLDTEEEGIMAKILMPDGTENVAIGTLIALLAEEGDNWQAVQVPDLATAAAPAPSASPQPETAASKHEYHSYGPAVRTMLDTYQLHTADIPASGPHGRLLKGDILDYVKQKKLTPPSMPVVPTPPLAQKPTSAASKKTADAPSPPAKPAPSTPLAQTEQYTDLELTNMRRIIAKRLTESKTSIPHAYASVDCTMDKLVKLRKDLIADGVKVSVNDFIVKAAAVALHRVPGVNAVWGGEAPRLLADVDICVAVATDSGLITPIVKDAVGLGVEEISNTVKDLATRARDNKLRPDEFQGGSFTISNLGMFGITEFSAVINPPQACIMAIGGSRLVLNEDGQPETRMICTLSCDARIVDDFLAAHFLEVFQEIMENPMTMLSQGPPVDMQNLFAK